MNKSAYISFLLTVLWSHYLMAQQKEAYSTKFRPHTVTYNGSPNPNECWESVAYGIVIKTKKEEGFFYMPAKVIETLKEKIGDTEALIEVIYYEEPQKESGAIGSVAKIRLKGEVIFRDSN